MEYFSAILAHFILALYRVAATLYETTVCAYRINCRAGAYARRLVAVLTINLLVIATVQHNAKYRSASVSYSTRPTGK